MKTKEMAGAAIKSAKEIRMEIKKHVPSSIKGTRECAIVVAMAASILAAPDMDECGKTAVQDMAHELHYTWDPFDGFIA